MDGEELREEHRQLRRSAQGRVAKILGAPFRFFRSRKTAPVELSEYECWLARHRLATDDVRRLREEAHAFVYQPLVSVLMPTFNSNEKYLAGAIGSALGQNYENWELIIVDDASASPAKLLEQVTDSRVRVFFEKQHAGISAALNVALSHARGDWIALLDHDDLLEPDALFRAIELLQHDRAVDVIYSDEDKIIDEHFAAPMLKSDWSPDFFLTHDYLGHFVVIRRDFVDEFRSGFDGAQDYDLLLRISEKTERIRHIPRVLYHWRRTKESTAHNIRRKPGALEAGRRALEEHLERRGTDARVTVDWETHVYRVRRQVTPPRIALVMFDATPRERARIEELTAGDNFEILSEPAALLDARSELLLFLDRDLEPLQKSWLSVLAEYAQGDGVGVVAPRIMAADDTVETAGLILLPGGKLLHAFGRMQPDFRGANRQLQTVRNYSAVSPSCLMTRREVWARFAVPGANGFSGVCAAVEYCLQLRGEGLRIVSVPYAQVRRASQHVPAAESCPHLAQRWPEVFARDPFYNPNLSRERGDFSLVEAQP